MRMILTALQLAADALSPPRNSEETEALKAIHTALNELENMPCEQS